MADCMFPVTVKSKKGITEKVRCGKCAPCLTFVRNEKFVRLREHMKDYDYTTFLTLTYSDENLTYGALYPTLCVRDVQLFVKRLRKKLGKFDISYYLVGEYGTKYQRPHMHMLLFGLSKKAVKKYVCSTWSKGNVHIGTVTERSINYVCKYHVLRNKNVPYGCQKPFLLTSKGIGLSYIDRMGEWHKDAVKERYFYQYYDIKFPLPRYYKDRLYTEDHKELLRSHFENFYKDKKVMDGKSRKEMYKELLHNTRICNKFGFKVTDSQSIF